MMAKRQPCYRIDPVTGLRLEEVTKANAKPRTEEELAQLRAATAGENVHVLVERAGVPGD